MQERYNVPRHIVSFVLELMPGGCNSIERYKMLTIRVKPISKAKFALFMDSVIDNLSFGPQFQYHKHIAEAAKVAGMTMDTAISLRSGILQTYVRKRIGNVVNNVPAIVADYSTMDIVSVADKWKMPPLLILRSIFETTYSQQQVKKLFSDKVSPISVLSGRDLDEFRVATAADGSVLTEPALVTSMAKYNEKLFAAYFIWKKFKIKTEEQLIAEQVAATGYAIITPDILFEEPIIINDQTIHWIDFKSYAGCDATFLYKKNVEQAKKYNEKFGPGAIVYRHGFVEMSIPDTLILDAREFEGFELL